MKSKRAEDLLLENNLISHLKFKKVMNIQRKNDTCLENSIFEVLGAHLRFPHIDLSNMSIVPAVAALIPAALAEHHMVIPIKITRNKLILAMVDPSNFYAIDDIRMASGLEVEPVIANEKDILLAIRKYYGVQNLVQKAVNKIQPENVPLTTKLQTGGDAPIIELVDSFLSQAIKDMASDIHIEPQDTTLRVRFRIDGMLREVGTFPREFHPAIVARIKIISEMDIAEKRIPQDGRIRIKEAGRDVDVRVSTLPTIMGEKVAMRLLDQNAIILDINNLSFSSENLIKYRNFYSQSYGMVLVTGPTGSGKTTTLYSTLSKVNSSSGNIITLEDPVEYRLAGINQVQINPKAGLTFASGLRSILRQDPNIILVGEIRDNETADIAIRAALTGRLVFSTLHTNDAAGAIVRLLDMDIEPFLIASSLIGVVAQRLVRVICSECKEKYTPSPDSLERLVLGSGSNIPIMLYRGVGCHNCNQTGYRGRMAIHEVIPITSQIREAINRKASSDEISKIAITQGMSTMCQDGIQKAMMGLTDMREVMRIAYAGIFGGKM